MFEMMPDYQKSPGGIPDFSAMSQDSELFPLHGNLKPVFI